MLHVFIFGLLLGLGASIPIGAINLEIIRRNLRFGTSSGMTFGLGACGGDLTFLALLSLGILQILNDPTVLRVTGIGGAIIMAWFGWQALRAQPEYVVNHDHRNNGQSIWKNLYQGYLLTLINPFTILFWTSVSLTIAANTQTHNAIFFAGLGVLAGTVAWVWGLNMFLQLTRHRISAKAMQVINLSGGLILLGFAIYSFWHALAIPQAS